LLVEAGAKIDLESEWWRIMVENAAPETRAEYQDVLDMIGEGVG